jgi:hypothetical protein
MRKILSSLDENCRASEQKSKETLDKVEKARLADCLRKHVNCYLIYVFLTYILDEFLISNPFSPLQNSIENN